MLVKVHSRHNELLPQIPTIFHPILQVWPFSDFKSRRCWCNMVYINISIATYTRNPKAKDNVSWLTPYKILKNRLYCPLSWLLLIAPPLTVAGRHSVPHEPGGAPVILIYFLDDHMCTKRLIIATTPSILSCFRKSTTGAIMQIIYLTNTIYNILIRINILTGASLFTLVLSFSFIYFF